MEMEENPCVGSTVGCDCVRLRSAFVSNFSNSFVACGAESYFDRSPRNLAQLLANSGASDRHSNGASHGNKYRHHDGDTHGFSDTDADRHGHTKP